MNFAYSLFYLEKTYIKVPREVLQWISINEEVPIKYIIKDMYNEIVANVRTYNGLISNFSIIIRLY